MTTAAVPRKKILLVDDEAAIVHSLRYNLEKNGYAVTTASVTAVRPSPAVVTA